SLLDRGPDAVQVVVGVAERLWVLTARAAVGEPVTPAVPAVVGVLGHDDMPAAGRGAGRAEAEPGGVASVLAEHGPVSMVYPLGEDLCQLDHGFAGTRLRVALRALGGGRLLDL